MLSAGVRVCFMGVEKRGDNGNNGDKCNEGKYRRGNEAMRDVKRIYE